MPVDAMLLCLLVITSCTIQNLGEHRVPLRHNNSARWWRRSFGNSRVAPKYMTDASRELGATRMISPRRAAQTRMLTKYYGRHRHAQQDAQRGQEGHRQAPLAAAAAHDFQVGAAGRQGRVRLCQVGSGTSPHSCSSRVRSAGPARKRACGERRTEKRQRNS